MINPEFKLARKVVAVTSKDSSSMELQNLPSGVDTNVVATKTTVNSYVTESEKIGE